jgi:hypothetical protein
MIHNDKQNKMAIKIALKVTIKVLIKVLIKVPKSHHSGLPRIAEKHAFKSTSKKFWYNKINGLGLSATA